MTVQAQEHQNTIPESSGIAGTTNLKAFGEDLTKSTGNALMRMMMPTTGTEGLAPPQQPAFINAAPIHFTDNATLIRAAPKQKDPLSQLQQQQQHYLKVEHDPYSTKASTPVFADPNSLPSYASNTERLYFKMLRWIAKLSEPNAVNTYNLTNERELHTVSRKFLAMVQTMRDAIEYEWIEEFGLDTKHGVDHPLQDLDHRKKKAHVDPPSEHMLLRMPDYSSGLQRPLHQEFNLLQYTEQFPGGGQKPASTFRQCMYCCAEIWNRGWMCKDTYESSGLNYRTAKHHVCCACFAQGMICESSHSMIMVQRFSVKKLLNDYRDAISAYNKVMLPLMDQIDDHEKERLGFMFPRDDNGGLLNEFDGKDPRPSGGRSDVTISYHLNLRYILNYEGVYCHQCKSKKPAWEVISCSNHEHIEAMQNGSTVKTRSGFYYCVRCLMNRYNMKSLDAFSDRNWSCYVCRRCCDCAACRPIFRSTNGSNSSSGGTANSSSTSLPLPKPSVMSGQTQILGTEPSTQPHEQQPQQTVQLTSNSNAFYKKRRRPESEEDQDHDHDNGPPHSHLGGQSRRRKQTDNIRRQKDIPLTHLIDRRNGNEEEEYDEEMSEHLMIWQKRCAIESARAEKAIKELEAYKDLKENFKSDEELIRENAKLKSQVHQLSLELEHIKPRLDQLERMYQETRNNVLPNLNKIAKAISAQSVILNQFYTPEERL
ncbi:hypothetical protein MP638_003915 [Amoeboaphelidium occidentale]|nr:hypothetical protein MP638_003915 [Amoeboaphelidium occidentale]